MLPDGFTLVPVPDDGFKGHCKLLDRYKLDLDLKAGGRNVANSALGVRNKIWA